MRYILISLTLLLTLSGCQDKKHLDEEAQAKHDAQIIKQVRAEVLAEFEAKRIQDEKAEAEKNRREKIQKEKLRKQSQEAKKLSNDLKNAPLTQIGIHLGENSISIDTNKTKTFLNTLSQKLEGHVKKISDDLERGIIDSKEAGIEINKEHIHIDLNKTQDMLEDWGKKIQLLLNEFEKVTKDITDKDITE